jgi:predicted metalloendopeptidase
MRKTRKREKRANFYTQINETSNEHMKLPPTETRITQTFYIQREINRELATLIAADKGPIASLVKSWVATEGTVPDGISSLIQVTMTMDSPSDIMSRIGWMNRYGMPAPLTIYIRGDPRNQQRCRVYIEEGQTEIGIPEYWLYPEYAGHRKAYTQYVNRLSAILGLPALSLGYSAEREFAHVFPTYINQRKERINMMTWGELCKEYRDMDWTALFTAWGLKEEKLPDLLYNVTSLTFLHHIQSRIHRWPMKRWQGWFALRVAEWIAGCSPHGPLRSAWFDYKRRFLQGTLADETPQELRSAIVRAMMPNTLGRLWVDKHCSAVVRRNISTMIDRIRDAAVAQLKHTEWMTGATRAAAVRKLQKMDIQVGWPDLDTWKPTEIQCGLVDDNLIENIMVLSAATTDTNQSMLLSGDCRHPYGEGWGKPVYEVNAYYYPDENRFLLPAAILRPPFYDPKKSLPCNYGAIGATIGHELCHAFDSDGRQYDENGNRRDWWSAHDDREYRKRAQKVVRLYESVQYRGLDVDGELTLVENIADIGGIGFAMGGLALALGRRPTKAELRDFFTSFAVSWRSKDRLRRAAELVVTNMHAPPMLRVNHVVSQMDEWYEAFDVGPDSPIWVDPAHRIQFFT